jgi:alkylated DNA nucleotide flippase Atl1
MACGMGHLLASGLGPFSGGTPGGPAFVLSYRSELRLAQSVGFGMIPRYPGTRMAVNSRGLENAWHRGMRGHGEE